MENSSNEKSISPGWDFVANKILKTIDTCQNFTQEAAINSNACALHSANAATFAERSESFSKECKDTILESKDLLKKLDSRSWWQLVISLLACVGIMLSVALFINSSNMNTIEAYKAATKTEVDAQNKNQKRLEKELDELKTVLKTALK